jgi:hypothetical protein
MVTTKLTHYPNGIAQFVLFAIGATVGTITCTGIRSATDRILQVLAMTLNATTGCVTAAADLTSEFTILSNDFINNAAGTTTIHKNVLVLVARAQS